MKYLRIMALAMLAFIVFALPVLVIQALDPSPSNPYEGTQYYDDGGMVFPTATRPPAYFGTIFYGTDIPPTLPIPTRVPMSAPSIPCRVCRDIFHFTLFALRGVVPR